MSHGFPVRPVSSSSITIAIAVGILILAVIVAGPA